MRGIRWFLEMLFVLLLSFLLLSCNGASGKRENEKAGYIKEFSKGPVSMEMRVDRTEINTAEMITVVLKAKAGDGWKPSFSDLSGKMDKFTLLTVTDSDPLLEDDGSTVLSRTFSLKPFLSGKYIIPSLSLDYMKGINKGVLLTSPVTVTVKSLLPENTDNLVLKDIKEPITFNFLKLILYSTISIIVLGIALLIFLLYRKHKREKIIPGLTPFEEAFSHLSLLLERNLPESGEYKEFYFQLNLIIRVYIEKQFAIRAPEQTTEEFLQDLSVSTKIGNDFKLILRDFLVHSDLVKFALHKPGNEEVRSSIESCKNFIKATGDLLDSEKSTLNAKGELS